MPDIRSLIPDVQLNPSVQRSLQRFIDCTPPQRLSRTVRIVFMEYIIHRKDSLPEDFQQQAEDLMNLFEFLDRVGCSFVKDYAE